MKTVNFILLILVIRKKYWRGWRQIPRNNGQYLTQEADLLNRRVILSILLCVSVDKHSCWTQLFSRSEIVPNDSPTHLFTRPCHKYPHLLTMQLLTFRSILMYRKIFISVCLFHAKWTIKWSFRENFFSPFLTIDITSCKAISKQVLVFSYLYKLF